MVEPVRGGHSPASTVFLSLPLAVRSLSVADPSSSRSAEGATASFGVFIELLPVGSGERAIGVGALFNFEFAICSKCDRKDDTGF